MTESEAIELLKHHSGTHEDNTHPKSEKGFLGILRPFDGQLKAENFHEVMNILRVLTPQFRSQCISKEVISGFWSICHFARMWALEENGMLRWA